MAAAVTAAVVRSIVATVGEDAEEVDDHDAGAEDEESYIDGLKTGHTASEYSMSGSEANYGMPF